MRKKRAPSFWHKLLAISCVAFSFSAAHAMLLAASDTSESPRQQRKAASAPRQSSEERLWQIAVDSDKAGAYDAYLRKYPNGRYAALAKSRLASIEAAAKNTVRSAGTPQPMQGNSQGSSSRPPAMIGGRDGLGLSAEDELWKAATATGKASDYRAYLKEYPEGRYASIAKNQLAISGLPEQYPTSTSGMSTSTKNAASAPAGEAMQTDTVTGERATTEPIRPSAEQEFRTNGTAASGPEKTIRFSDQTMTGNFSTDSRTGKVSGTGRIVWSNGNRFEGTLNRGVKEGKGQFSWNSGQRYIGDWANDLPNGKGTIYFANGDRYEGDVKDGQAHGQGIARFKGGDSYAGSWFGGRRHGTGRYSWAQGGYWEGEFRNGERTDNGTLTRAQSAPLPAPQPALGDGKRQEGQAVGRFP
jgi:hypothetical protein